MTQVHFHPEPFARRQAGLTLVELLLVLFILAVLAGVALQSTEGLAEQSRYEATQSTLGNVESAIIGSANAREADGTAVVTGFVADIGRLPLAVGMDADTQLRELWENAGALPTFAITAPAGDAQVRVGGGWRGPYLRLGAGSDRLTDGWGHPLQLLRADDGTPVGAGDPIEIARSLGRDGLAGGADYDADQAVIFERTGALIDQVPARYAGTLTGQVYLDNSGDNPGADANVRIVVRLYGPINGAIGTIKQFVAEPTGGLVTYTFDDDNNMADDPVSIGPRVIRAYLLNSTIAAPLPEQRLDNDANLTAVSAPTRVTIHAGGMTRDLILITQP